MSKKILQIDGGGLKGIIPATVLAHFEEVLRKRCSEVFDLITGTSTGNGTCSSSVQAITLSHESIAGSARMPMCWMG
jgi:patatin-like phospholipase/acyl hydrolase